MMPKYMMMKKSIQTNNNEVMISINYKNYFSKNIILLLNIKVKIL